MENLTIIPMLPSEYQSGGSVLTIRYGYISSLFGQMLLAWTEKGICYTAFDDDRQQALHELRQLFPKAQYIEEKEKQRFPQQISTLHIKGTAFQLQVWEALLQIPIGTTASYSDIARQIGKPHACRAVGSAIGANPISLYIPCHRVIRSNGEYGEYHWGGERKRKMIEWEKGKQIMP